MREGLAIYTFDVIQSQPLRSSFRLVTPFAFSSLMFEGSDSERLDRFSEGLIGCTFSSLERDLDRGFEGQQKTRGSQIKV